MPYDPQDLSVLMTLLRLLHGWSQSTAAEESAIHPSSISKYERGRKVPYPATIERLAAAARVPMWVVEGVVLPAIALARECAHADRVAVPPHEADAARALLQSPGPSLDLGAIAVARFLAVPIAADEGAPAGPPGDDPWTLLALPGGLAPDRPR